MDWVKSQARLIILSDTFEQFATPHGAIRLPNTVLSPAEIADDGRITGYKLRMPDQKRHSVNAFRDLGFRVMAFGDSYNDTTMLEAADRGVLIPPSEP